MKNGFTIIEILATVTLMLLVAAILIPSVTYLSNDVKKTQYEAQVKSILIGAKEYGEDNINSFESGECLKRSGRILKISDLVENGYVKATSENKTAIIDPRSNQSMNEIEVCVKYVNYSEDDKDHFKVISCMCETEPCDCSA